MSADDLFRPGGAFTTDWLAGAGQTDSSDTSNDPSALDFLASPSLESGAAGAQQGGSGIMTQEELERALLGDLDGAGAGLSDEGTSGMSGGASSEGASSPFHASNYSYSGASNAPSSSAFDIDAVLASSSSPSFPLDGDFSSLSCEFDTDALQSLFATPCTSTFSPGSTASARLAPFPSAPVQTVSPASATSPYSAPAAAFPLVAQGNDMSNFDFSQIFGPAASVAGSPLQLQQTGAEYGSPTSFVSLSPSAALSAPPASTSPQALGSLAATAGIAVQPLQATANPRAGPYAFSLKQDPGTSALLQASGRTVRNRQAPPVTPQLADLPVLPPSQPQPAAKGASRQPSPLDVIVNAGLQNGVHQAPPLQLLANVDFSSSAFKPAIAPSGKAAGKKAAAEASAGEDAQEDKPVKGGKKGAKKERGHNAVEQKYRNSINNALATLRDTIPALRHLKPLPSMPVNKRKASQFQLATAAVPQTPAGLVDGIEPAKNLSKGVILNKACEYIDYLRFARESRDSDLEMLKSMVCEMVGGGDRLVEEFDRRRAELEVVREEERLRQKAEEEDDDGEGEDDDEEDEPAPVPAPAAKGRRSATAAGTKRGRKADAAATTTKKARSAGTAGLSPPLTSDYRHVQALNQAHLETLASAGQAGVPMPHVFPPSPVSSGDELSVSPSALMGESTNSGSGGRVLLASFMGLSFAGGLGYDVSTSAVAAEEALTATAARVLTGRLARRDLSPDATLVERIHPSLLSGLVALGAATVVIALAYLVFPLFSRSASTLSPRARRRVQAVSALSAISASSAVASTYGQSCSAAMRARKELLRFVAAPGPLALVAALVKEALVWGVRHLTGLTLARDKSGVGQEEVEEAVAWVRIAEIEASVGDRIPTIYRLYTFLRLSNLSRSPYWPQLSPTTSRSAVDALLAIHLLALGHPRWAEVLWHRMVAQRKKVDSARSQATDSFVDVAVASEWEAVRTLLAPSIRAAKSFEDLATSSDTVPLLVLAEAACEESLRDAWTQIFVAVSAETATSPSGQAAAESLAGLSDVDAAIERVSRATVDGSDLRTLAVTAQVFLTCYRAGTRPASARADLGAARTLLSQLVLGLKEDVAALERLACIGPFLRLLAPALSGPLATELASLIPTSSTLEPTSEIDLLATIVFSWLLVRREAVYVEKLDGNADEEVLKPNASLHVQALAVRRLLGSAFFPSPARSSLSEAVAADDNDLAVDDAKDALVDALTTVARTAAGLKGGLDEDSGVELEA
ncbi:uncharacterized protein JCM10292_004906 [Rhodotorula paludigena]|uniref:uncharacterized protein n=1 Tax=Rhodotorula paludigena TaxID=86838 RepID=UPI00317AC8C4